MEKVIICSSFIIRALVFGLKLREKIPAFTLVNSMKTIQEGIFLKEHNIDPYSGRLVNSMPFIIFLENFIKNQELNCIVFALLDSLTGVFLYYGSRNYLQWKVS